MTSVLASFMLLIIGVPLTSGRTAGKGCWGVVAPSTRLQLATGCLLCGSGSGSRSRRLTLIILIAGVGVLLDTDGVEVISNGAELFGTG